MDLNAFQGLAGATALYPNRGKNLTYPILGLLGEAGELANSAKRIQRDDGGKLTYTRRNELISELGDVLWYLSQVAAELDVPLDDVAATVLNKLSDRAARGVIHGKGDKR